MSIERIEQQAREGGIAATRVIDPTESAKVSIFIPKLRSVFNDISDTPRNWELLSPQITRSHPVGSAMAVIIRTGDILVRRPLFPRSLLTIIPSSIHPSIPVTEAAAAAATVELSLSSSTRKRDVRVWVSLASAEIHGEFHQRF